MYSMVIGTELITAGGIVIIPAAVMVGVTISAAIPDGAGVPTATLAGVTILAANLGGVIITTAVSPIGAMNIQAVPGSATYPGVFDTMIIDPTATIGVGVGIETGIETTAGAVTPTSRNNFIL